MLLRSHGFRRVRRRSAGCFRVAMCAAATESTTWPELSTSRRAQPNQLWQTDLFHLRAEGENRRGAPGSLDDPCHSPFPWWAMARRRRRPRWCARASAAGGELRIAAGGANGQRDADA